MQCMCCVPQEALSWREYVAGTSVALAFFLAWYLAFGALVLAQRWPAWYNLVGPRAPSQYPAGLNTYLSLNDPMADCLWSGSRCRGGGGGAGRDADGGGRRRLALAPAAPPAPRLQ